MVSENTFRTVTDDMLVEMIDGAQERLVFVAPGVRLEVAQALARAEQRLRGKGAVNFILDVDAEVCRLGYGTIDGLKLLQNVPGMNCNVLNAQPGVRIGIVIADDDTLFYSPTPLLIEAEPHVEMSTNAEESAKTVNKPNGVLIRKSVPPAVASACSADGNYANREIGLDPVNEKDVALAAASLERTPPKKFDIARQERVFTSKVCFVELEITNYQIGAKKVVLDSALFVLDKDARQRLTNRFKVFDKDRMPNNVPYMMEKRGNVTLSMKFIEDEIASLRKSFLINVGPWGTVILRNRLEEFESRVEEIMDMLRVYKSKVESSIEKMALETCGSLTREMSDKLIEHPPAVLENRLSLATTRAEKFAIITEYISKTCEKAIAQALHEFSPQVKRVVKDVTYTTFSDPKFIEYLTKALGPDCMKRIFEEHDSAREVDVND